MRNICILLFLFINGVSLANIEDHLLYERSERGGDDFDAVVSIKINHFYAFSEKDLIYTYGKERGRYLSEWHNGSRNGFMGQYWCSSPDLNARRILISHTTWIFDVDIEKCMSGGITSNRCFIAMKKTPAFHAYESPDVLLEHGSDYISTNLVVGLVRIDKDEFLRSFRSKALYMNDDLAYVKLITNEDELKAAPSILKSISRNIDDITIDAPCYVARDIGTIFMADMKLKALTAYADSLRSQNEKKPLVHWLIDDDKSDGDQKSVNQIKEMINNIRKSIKKKEDEGSPIRTFR